MRGTSNEILKQKRIEENKAGSSCPKKFLALSKEYDPHGICTASKKYQDIKLQELEAKKDSLTIEEFEKSKIKITEKSCLCVGLANASYLENDIKIKGQSQGVVICPGPNLAYFDQEVSLKDMLQHIYQGKSILRTNDRPNLFVKELKMYVDYFRNEIETISGEVTANQLKKWNSFKTNILEGIEYYQNLLSSTLYFKKEEEKIRNQFNFYKSELNAIQIPTLELA
ncbi:CRISPR/Cas system CMR subunit Cmr6 (Cas7 group RAMP superfamily) [Flavobacterium sp. SORGH_AS 622]|nr:CRISPR/Cas system CMR subunit Cmr6 (Cas7 group RAMP superfamily) [Flavobacterium sp. SORGH_AS_0622]